MEINIRPITGNWAHGWALDRHTVNSTAGDSDSFIPPDLDREQRTSPGAEFEFFVNRPPSFPDCELRTANPVLG